MRGDEVELLRNCCERWASLGMADHGRKGHDDLLADEMRARCFLGLRKVDCGMAVLEFKSRTEVDDRVNISNVVAPCVQIHMYQPLRIIRPG